MKEFIIENWKVIVALGIEILLSTISFIALVILNLIKKRGKVPVLSYILQRLPQLIISAEEFCDSGEEKKKSVLSIVSHLHKKILGSDPGAEELKIYDEAIEDILACPQKKERK